MSSHDYQLVWMSGEQPVLIGYVVAYGEETSIKVVRALLFDVAKLEMVGEPREYLVQDFKSSQALADLVHESLRKMGADAIYYSKKVFPVDSLNGDLNLNLPFMKIKRIEQPD